MEIKESLRRKLLNTNKLPLNNPSPYKRIALFSSLGMLGVLSFISASLMTITVKKIDKEARIHRKEIADRIYQTTNKKVYILS